MKYIKVLNSNGAGKNTKVFIDYEPVKKLRSLKLSFAVDEIVTAELEVLPGEVFYEGEAQINMFTTIDGKRYALLEVSENQERSCT